MYIHFLTITMYIQGMDIPDIARVIVYGLPDTIAQYYQVSTDCICVENAYPFV